MKIVCSTLPFRKIPITEAIKAMANLGVESIELCVEPLHSNAEKWDAPEADVLQLAQDSGIVINSIHVPSIDLPAPSDNYSIKSVWTQTTEKTITLAASCKAEFIVQHIRLSRLTASTAKPLPLEDMLPDLNRSVVCAELNRVKLAFENVPTISNRMLGINISEVMDVISYFSSDTVGLCLDLTHCIAAGYDPLEALADIDAERLLSIHASDNFAGNRQDTHLALGKGDIPWKQLFQHLDRLNFRGSFVIEVAGENDAGGPLIESLEFIKHLAIAA